MGLRLKTKAPTPLPRHDWESTLSGYPRTPVDFQSSSAYDYGSQFFTPRGGGRNHPKAERYLPTDHQPQNPQKPPQPPG